MLNPKKACCMVLALLMMAQGVPVFAASSEHILVPGENGSEVILGDINRDGTVDYADSAILSDYFAGNIDMNETDFDLTAADFTRDGVLMRDDAMALQRYVGEWSSSLAPVINDISESDNDFKIVSTEVDCESGESGSTFTWITETFGGVGEVEYSFVLNKYDENDTAAAEQAFSTDNSFEVQLYEAGSYSVTVMCRDSAGEILKEEDICPVSVSESAPQASVVCEQGRHILAGSSVKWTVNTVAEAYEYYYTLMKNGEELVSIPSSSPSYTIKSCTAGVYVLAVEFTDQEGNIITLESEELNVYTASAYSPAAPVLSSDNENVVFTNDAADAVTAPANSIQLLWNDVAEAKAYGLNVEYLANGVWENVVKADALTETRYLLPIDIFKGFSEETLFKIQIYSIGITAGEAEEYYFIAEPISNNTEISVDGRWDISSKYSTSRRFVVNSALKWTAADDSDWISCDESEGYLIVTIDENPARTERSGKITVTNGIETAEMIVNQGYYNDALILSYPRLSNDINNPSQRPIGGISIRFEEEDAPYVEVRISELGLDGAKTVIFDKVLKYKENYVRILEDDFASALRTNRTYMLELFARYSEDCAMYERDEDAESDQYYFCMTADGHELLIEGSDYYECTAYSDVKAAIYSTNTWTCSTDCDWINPEKYEITDYTGDIEYLDIWLSPNYTSQSRTGTITYTAGDEKAVISITQPSCLPSVISPSLSETQSSPTTLNGGGVLMSVYCDTLTYSKLYRGSWSEEKVYFKVVSLVETEHSIVIESGDFDANATYRFTLTKGEYTKQYYVKFNSTKKNYVALYNDDLNLVNFLSWDISSGASSRIIEAYANKAFTVSSTQNWLTVSPTKGYADEDNEFTVTAAKNTTSNERTAKLQFKIGTTVSAELTVTQAASDSLAVFVERDDAYTKYNNGDVIKTVFGSGDDFEAAVMASDLWNAKSNCNWITFDDETSIVGIDPYESVYMTVDTNTTGRTRTGTVTISCGNQNVTLTVEQAPKLDSITVLSPDFSTNHKTPTVRMYDDIVVKWNTVDNAVSYLVRIFPEDASLNIDEFASFRKEIIADGSVAYSVVIPKDVLSLNGAEWDRISVGAYDMYGDSVGKSMYFINTQAEAVRLDNSMTPVWDNAEDIAVSRTFNVSSTGNWTASSGSSWISIDKQSGVNGDTLTVSLQTNTGAARSGYVTVKTGNTSIVLTVNQCAVLEKYPKITSPVYSSDSGAPTMIPSDTSTLTVNWNAAPQAEFYEIEILTYKSNAVMKTVYSSPIFRKGENTYTFENLDLKPGNVYILSIMQKSRLGACCDYTYFMPEDSNAWVLAGNKEKIEYSLNSGEDYGRAVITSSGMWTASADVDWIMLDDSHITSADLAEDGYTAADFSSYRGYSGDKLYMSALKNPDNKMRTGTVTVRCGSDEAIITVSQEPDYKVAEVYSPVLGKSDDESVSLPMGNVVLHWNACVGGKGTYQVVLEELEDGYYYDIHEVTGITSTQYSIPSNLLREGGYYRVGLYSDIEGLDNSRSPGERYYFHVRYANELAVNAGISFSGNMMMITSSASGGAGDYKFSYELIQDGSSKVKTDLSNGANYTFTITENSVYQVVVYCRDAEGNTAKFVSANIDLSANADDSIKLSRSTWTPAAGGESVSLEVTSGGAWNIEFYPNWISCSASKGSDGDKVTLIAEKNGEETRSGTVVITSGTASAKLEVVQNGMDLHAEITAPKAGAVVSAGSVCVEWTEPDGAEGFVFSLNDMTSDLVIINQMSVDESEYTISADALLRGHNYKVAVGAICNGQKYWSTVEFSVEPSQAGNNPNPIPGQHVHTYQRNVSTITTENETTAVHKVTTKYYEVCSECGDKTEYKTETVFVSHVYSSDKKYEVEHPHKVFVKCACGAAKYLEDEYKTSNGFVQEPESTCCICQGDVFDYDNPRPLNGNWVVFCKNCGITKQVDAPASEEDAVHVHFPAVYYDDDLIAHEYCSICEPRTKVQFEKDSINLQRKMDEIQANADAVSRAHAVDNIVSKNDSVSNLLSHFKERHRTAWVQMGKLRFRQATFQWGDIIRSIIPGSEVVDDIRREAVQAALASVLGYTDEQLESVKNTIEELMDSGNELMINSYIVAEKGYNVYEIVKKVSDSDSKIIKVIGDTSLGDWLEIALNISLEKNKYDRWSERQKLIFYDLIITTGQCKSFLEELVKVYKKDKIIVNYCKDFIKQIELYDWNKFAAAINDNKEKIEAYNEIGQDTKLKFLEDLGIGSVVSTVLASAGAVATFTGKVGGILADAAWGTQTTADNLEYLDILYCVIIDSIELYDAAELIPASDKALDFQIFNIYFLKCAGLELAREVDQGWFEEDKGLQEGVDINREHYQKYYDTLMGGIGSEEPTNPSLPTIPSVPRNLKATTIDHDSIKLTWSAVDGADGYIIFRSAENEDFITLEKRAKSTSWTDNSCEPDTTYTYIVGAYIGSIYGNASSAASATTDAIDKESLVINTNSVNWLFGPGNEASIYYTASEAIQVAVDADWITYEIFDTYVWLRSKSANNSTLSRAGKVTITCGSITKTVTVVQDGNPNGIPGTPTVTLKLGNSVLTNGYTHVDSYTGGDICYIEAKFTNTDHFYRSFGGDASQNKVWNYGIMEHSEMANMLLLG